MKSLLVLLAFFPLTLFADNHNRPCAEDVKRLCADVKRGQGRIKKCLREKRDQLSPACKERVQKRMRKVARACEQDIASHCGDVQKGEGRIRRCLRAKKDMLSAECKAAMHRRKRR